MGDFPHLTRQMLDEACKGYETTCDDPDMKKQALQMLPSLSQACRLCDIFLDHGEYLYVRDRFSSDEVDKIAYLYSLIDVQ